MSDKCGAYTATLAVLLTFAVVLALFAIAVFVIVYELTS